MISNVSAVSVAKCRHLKKVTFVETTVRNTRRVDNTCHYRQLPFLE